MVTIVSDTIMYMWDLHLWNYSSNKLEILKTVFLGFFSFMLMHQVVVSCSVRGGS